MVEADASPAWSMSRPRAGWARPRVGSRGIMARAAETRPGIKSEERMESFRRGAGSGVSGGAAVDEVSDCEIGCDSETAPSMLGARSESRP